MSGHNKWSKIQHKKGAADAARGKVFTKIIREIMVAARDGGGDPDMNARLRTAILAGKDANMPKDNIDRAVKKGSGDLEGVSFVEATYEGYGPGGVAIVVDCLTDNKNRTVAEIRHIFSKAGGKIAESGSVSYLFKSKGIIEFDKEKINEEDLMEKALDAGAEDVEAQDDRWIVTTPAADYMAVRKKIEDGGLLALNGEITKIPDTTVPADEHLAEQIIRIVGKFEESDDVQKCYTNVDIPDEIFEMLNG